MKIIITLLSLVILTFSFTGQATNSAVDTLTPSLTPTDNSTQNLARTPTHNLTQTPTNQSNNESECLQFLNILTHANAANFRVSDGSITVDSDTGDHIHWTQEASWHYDFYFYADLTWDGLLDIVVFLKDEKLNLRSSMNGKKLFKETMRFFKLRHIRALKASWVIGSDNYQQYYQAIADGDTPAEAAFKTWTGKQALAYGFDRIHSIEITGQNSEDWHKGTKIVIQFDLNPAYRLMSNLLLFF